MQEGSYNDAGEKVSFWSYYHENGRRKRNAMYNLVGGLLEDLYYYASGNVESSYTYTMMGDLHEEVWYYDDAAASKEREIKYENGQQTSKMRWSEDGDLLSKQVWK